MITVVILGSRKSETLASKIMALLWNSFSNHDLQFLFSCLVQSSMLQLQLSVLSTSATPITPALAPLMLSSCLFFTCQAADLLPLLQLSLWPLLGGLLHHFFYLFCFFLDVASLAWTTKVGKGKTTWVKSVIGLMYLTLQYQERQGTGKCFPEHPEVNKLDSFPIPWS